MEIRVEKAKKSKFAVISGEGTENEISEIVVADRLIVADLTVNLLGRTIKMALVFGGYDSLGKWHTDTRQQAAIISISGDRAEQKEAYESLVHCPKGNPHCNYGDEFFTSILTDSTTGFELANKVVWGESDMEIYLDEKSAFKVEKGKVIR